MLYIYRRTMKVTKIPITPVAQLECSQAELDVISKALSIAFDTSNFSHSDTLTYGEGLTASTIRAHLSSVTKL